MTLPWLAAPLAEALSRERGHATLVHAAAGLGALEFALDLARGGLCEAADARTRPCGRCASCLLFAPESRAHPDLFVALPETLHEETGWPLRTDETRRDASKPSRQLRIGQVRALIDWAHHTSARGRGKVAVLHPAETLNVASASALLKTLEEPPPGTRLVLTTADPARLLPTVLSRCQRVRIGAPPRAQAQAWLAEQGVPAGAAAVLLAACDGRPLDALARHRAGEDAAAWAALPAAMARGQAAALAGWAPARVVDALLKLCHDALAQALGGTGRYFPAGSVPAGAAPAALAAWWRELQRVARHAEHPWNEPLLLEALVAQAARALAPTRRAGRVAPNPLATLPR